MSSALPPGFTVDKPAAGGSSLPPGFTVDAAPPPDPAQQSRIGKVAAALRFGNEPSAGDVLAHNVTLGLQRPLTGAMEGVRSWWGGEGFSPGYEAGETAYDQFMNEARDKSGWAGTGAGLVGSVIAGGPARSAGSALLSKAPALVKTAINTGTQAGIQGAAESEGSLTDRALQTGKSALEGAGIGAFAHGLGDKVGSWWSRRQAKTAQPYKTTAAVEAASDAKYKQVDESGAHYPMDQTDTLLQGLDKTLVENTATPGLDDRAIALVNRIKKDWAGKPINPTELDKVRRWVDKKLIAGNPRGPDAELGYRLKDEIDNFAKQGEVIDPVTGQPNAQVNQDLLDARSLKSRQYRSEAVDTAASKAERQAKKTGSALFGGNIENTRRQQFEKLQTKIEESKTGGYSPDEAARIKQIAEGTPWRNIGRLGGVISPARGSIPALTHLALSPFTGGLSTVAGIGGEVVSQLGRRATTKEIEDLAALVRDPTGKGLATDPAKVAQIRDMLTRIMAGGQRSAGGGQ